MHFQWPLLVIRGFYSRCFNLDLSIWDAWYEKHRFAGLITPGTKNHRISKNFFLLFNQKLELMIYLLFEFDWSLEQDIHFLCIVAIFHYLLTLFLFSRKMSFAWKRKKISIDFCTKVHKLFLIESWMRIGALKCKRYSRKHNFGQFPLFDMHHRSAWP